MPLDTDIPGETRRNKIVDTVLRASPSPFDLFCYANRREETDLRRCIGLIERHLGNNPDDQVAQGCRAGLLIQSSDRSHPERSTDIYTRFALRIQQAMLLGAERADRAKILFCYGTSLAQIGPRADFDPWASVMLTKMVEEGSQDAAFPQCRPEAMIALALIEQENGETEVGRDLFRMARKSLGRLRAAEIFQDYLRLRHRSRT